jgi:transposase-like protein
VIAFEEGLPMPRRTFTREFMESAARIDTEQGYRVTRAAEGLGIDRASITARVRQIGVDPRR